MMSRYGLLLVLMLLCAAVFFPACSRNAEPPAPASAHSEAPPPAAAEPAPPQTVERAQAPASVPATAPVPAPVPAPVATSPPEQPATQQPAALHEHGDQQATYRVPPYFENPEAARVLPPTMDPAAVPLEAQAAYQVAKENPKLLAQLPCFCYCDRFGHKSLHDCYVGEHAEQCDICQKEALEADQMAKQGISLQEIRSVIIERYHPRNPE